MREFANKWSATLHIIILILHSQIRILSPILQHVPPSVAKNPVMSTDAGFFVVVTCGMRQLDQHVRPGNFRQLPAFGIAVIHPEQRELRCVGFVDRRCERRQGAEWVRGCDDLMI